MRMAYIYIMTNPALRDMVKIGFATDVEQRSTIKAGGAASQRNDILAKAAQMLHGLGCGKNPFAGRRSGLPSGRLSEREDVRVLKNRRWRIRTGEFGRVGENDLLKRVFAACRIGFDGHAFEMLLGAARVR